MVAWVGRSGILTNWLAAWAGAPRRRQAAARMTVVAHVLPDRCRGFGGEGCEQGGGMEGVFMTARG